MKPARLTHLLIFERSTSTVTASGGVDESWAEFARARAELVETSTAEETRERGTVTTTAMTFRARWTPGITVADRVVIDGKAHDIVSLAEIGRREGWEIKLRRTGL